MTDKTDHLPFPASAEIIMGDAKAKIVPLCQQAYKEAMAACLSDGIDSQMSRNHALAVCAELAAAAELAMIEAFLLAIPWTPVPQAYSLCANDIQGRVKAAVTRMIDALGTKGNGGG